MAASRAAMSEAGNEAVRTSGGDDCEERLSDV